MKEKKVRTQIFLDKDLFKVLKSISKKNRISVSKIIRDVVRQNINY